MSVCVSVIVFSQGLKTGKTIHQMISQELSLIDTIQDKGLKTKPFEYSVAKGEKGGVRLPQFSLSVPFLQLRLKMN